MAPDPSQKAFPSDDPADGKLSSPSSMHPPLPSSVVSNHVNGTHESSTLLQQHQSTSSVSSSPFPEHDEDEWAMPTRSTIYLIWLTLIMAGIQIAWTVELGYINPYLLSLGLPKSTLSLIWIAGPVSGVIMQPLIGMMSDKCSFKWGRRRIFIVVSTIGVVVGFIGMGQTRTIIRWLTGRGDWESTRNAVIALAIASLILLDLTINASIILSSYD
jgi:MFS/sugar transport protein